MSDPALIKQDSFDVTQPPISLAPHPAHEYFHQPVGFLPAIQSLIYVLVVALFLMSFTVQPIRIPSESMEPTLLVGDFLLLDKQAVAKDPSWLLPHSGVERGDVIVFHDPVDDPSIHLVKRVIGIPGDRIHLHDGVVYRNGKPLQEGYAIYLNSGADTYRDNFPSLQTMNAQVKPNWWIRLRTLVQNGEVKVPEGSYFVLGDNRNDSEDSRYWGFVPKDAIVGKPVLVYFSWRRPGEERFGVPHPPLISHILGSYGDFARWERTFHVVK